MASRKTLEQWLSEALNDPDKTQLVNAKEAPAPCTMLSLVHINGSQEKEIHTIKLGGKKFDDAGIKSLAEMISGKAQTDCQDLNGNQEYVILAFYEGSKEPQARLPIRAHGQILNQSGLIGTLGTDQPTETGRIQQRMRVDDGLTQIFMIGISNLVTQQNRFIEMQGQRSEILMRENMEMFSSFKEMMHDKIMDDRKSRMEEMAFERASAERQGMMRMLPALANTFFGREVFPVGTADTAIIEGVAEHLEANSNDVEKLTSMNLPPSLQMLIMTRLTEIKEAKKKAISIAKESALANSNPEAADRELQ